MKRIFFASLLLVSQVFASEALSTKQMDEVIAKVEEKAAELGRENVLLVFDIDNTILTAKDELGSDQWYSWQEKIMKEANCAPACITTDINKLLEAQALLFNIGKMLPTETELPAKVKELQAKGQKIILLTSRGSEGRSVTEKALKNAGYDFNVSALATRSGPGATYIPYDIKNPGKMGLTETDIQVAGLKEARPVSYQNGVYMTSGQNKGIMLKVLLNKYHQKYKAIVFADDHQRHVDRMQAILGTTYDVTTYRYGGVDHLVEKFNASDKKDVTERWYKLLDSLKALGFEQ